MLSYLEQYAEQCAAERLAKQIQNDVLSFVEFEDDDDLEDIRFIIASGKV